MPRLLFRTSLSNPDWTFLSGVQSFVQTGSSVFAGAEAQGGFSQFTLTDGAALQLADASAIDGQGDTYRTSTLISWDDANLLAAESGHGGHVSALGLTPGGKLASSGPLSFAGMTPAEITTIETLTGTDGGRWLVTASDLGQGLSLWRWDTPTSVTHAANVADTAKLGLSGISDMARVSLGGTDHLLAVSEGENAVTLFELGDGGTLVARDMLDTDRGFWVSDPGDVAAVAAHGVQYGVVAAAGSGSLTLIRLDDSHGAMQITDHVNDTLDTRFARVDAMTTFEVDSRGFVVAGGNDDGLTLFEILPDGRLFAHDSVAQQSGWTLDDVTAISAVDTGSEIHILAAGEGMPGVTQMVISKSSLPAPQIGTEGSAALTGGAGDDLLYGGAAGDILSGGAGDDVLYGGAGPDGLTGGAGADTFVFDADTARDVVTDFTPGEDQLDLGRWGRIYDVSALTVASRDDGAVVFYGDKSVQLVSGSRIEAADLADSLVFSGNGYIQREEGGAPGASSGALVSGLGGARGFGEGVLERSDDGSLRLDAAALFPDGLHYFGNHYTGADLWVNTNGTVSFGAPLDTAPSGEGAVPPGDVIAPFWADIDTRVDGQGPDSGQIWIDQDGPGGTLTITWDGVGKYGFDAGQTNAFQLQLTNRGGGDFDITARHDRIDWADTASHDGEAVFSGLSGLRLPEAMAKDGDPLGFEAGGGITTWEMRGGTVDNAVLSDGQTLTGTEAGDVLTGGAGADLLRGAGGPDILRGNDGDDWLFGGDGGDTLNAGAGNDTIQGGETADDLRDVVYAGAGDDSVDAGYGNDLVYGGDGADAILGGFGVDELIGQGGDDTLSGGAWSDEIFGGAGVDFINGGFGFDRVNGGDGGDMFFHLGIRDHGADWIQDYDAAEGDVLFYGGGAGAASPDDFLVQTAVTEGAGDAGVAETFITHAPSGTLMWALVDGDGQDSLMLRIGPNTFDLLE